MTRDICEASAEPKIYQKKGLKIVGEMLYNTIFKKTIKLYISGKF